MSRLERYSHVASIVETLIILVSVFFIVQQLRSQTEAMRAQMSLGLIDVGVERSYHLLDHPEFAASLRQGRRDFPSLDAEAQERYRLYVYTQMFFYEAMFLQHRMGYIDDDTFLAWRNAMSRYRDEMARPHWAGWEKNFSPDFVAYFKSLTPMEFVGF